MRAICPCYLFLAAALAIGCSAPSKQLAAVQEDKEQLLATIREQRDANRSLRDHVASLETRLDQAEKELARRGGSTRISSRPDPSPPVRNESLPWRSPGENQTPYAPKPASSSSGSDNGRSSSARPATAALRLAAMAGRGRRMQYAPQSHSARFESAVEFDGNAAALSAEGKRQLGEFVRFLKSEPARELRIMVAGYAEGRSSTTGPIVEGESRVASARQLGAARAQAVADYLDRHGIAQERLAITGVGSRGIQADFAKNSGGVQIYLVGPETNVVGWVTPETTRR